MLRVTALHAASAVATAAYYTRYLADSPGEAPGRWTGRQAADLGLSGRVDADGLQRLLEGRHPINGASLGLALRDRPMADGRVIGAVAGFDATFSAPKSVSVWWALTGDLGLLEAHDLAVQTALDHLERYGATTRVRHSGRRLHPDTVGLTMATFRQTTSRADDPQLHTHAVISAKVQTLDGRWLALDARFLTRQQRTLGGLYQSVLRAELTHRYGVQWQPIVNGQAELAGLPAELLAVFSKRTVQVEAALGAKVGEFRGREGRDPSRWERAAMEREAAADTRGRKTGDPVADLQDRWRSEALAAGWTAERLTVALIGPAQEPSRPGPVAVEDVLDQLSTVGSTWTRADMLRTVCDLTAPTAGLAGAQCADELERRVDEVLARCIDLDPDSNSSRRRSDGRSVWLEPTSPQYTSPAVLAEEERILDWALAAHHTQPHPSATVDREGLDVLQADATAAVAGADLLVLVVGPAGTGKTTMLRAAVQDLRRHGRTVFGLAPTAKAAHVLGAETGMNTDTVAKLLHEWHQSGRLPDWRYRLPHDTTVIVDEAGMSGTRSIHQLIALADRLHWRLVLVGDPRQLQAVGRGGLFTELCRSTRTYELSRIHRFSHRWEADASLALRAGDPDALDAYIDHGRVQPGTLDDHLEQIANAWLTHSAAGRTVAIMASSNQHVDTLNSRIQHARIAAGQLDPSTALPIAGGEQAHVGEIVVTRRNDRRLTTSTGEIVRNRELWTVTATHPDGSVTVERNGRVTVILPVDYVRQHVRLGYAATEHGHQGDTVDIGIALASAATGHRGLYVGVTRGRDDNQIHVITDTADLTEARSTLEAVLTTIGSTSRPSPDVASSPTPASLPVIKRRTSAGSDRGGTGRTPGAWNCSMRSRPERPSAARPAANWRRSGHRWTPRWRPWEPYRHRIRELENKLDGSLMPEARRAAVVLADTGRLHRRIAQKQAVKAAAEVETARREIAAIERDGGAVKHRLDEARSAGTPLGCCSVSRSRR